MMIQAKKSLGQNFLKNETMLQKIAGSLEIKENEVIVEIGPGLGALTKYLVSSPAKKIIAIEKDHRLIEGLKEKFTDERFSVIEGDALEILPALDMKEFKLIGNIPYYITGHLMRIVSELKNKPSVSVFVVQKEVAERAIMKEPENNILSLSLQFWSNPEFLGTIKREDFIPVPKVDSAILRLTTRESETDQESFFRTVHLIFKQPRKTILNNLSAQMEKSEAEKIIRIAKLVPSLRPGNLSLDDIKRISAILN